VPETIARTGRDPTSGKRYRLPGITREGIAQLSLLETALWPLKGGVRDAATFDTAYTFKTGEDKQDAGVSVYAPLGLQSIDEFILWGLLGMSLSRQQSEPTLLATPYWIMRRLGMDTGGTQYDQLRASLERLALVAYQNTAFYNPVTQQHERVTLHFFSSYLPTRGHGGVVDPERTWRIEWSPMFFQMCQATGGTLLFDYRAKHGKRHVRQVVDPGVTATIRRLKSRRGGIDELLAYKERGRWHDVKSTDINAYLKDATDKQWVNDADYKEWDAWMKKYLPDANPADSGNTYAYAVSSTMRHCLKGCGDNLTRENLMKQAASMKKLVVPMLLPGITINTSPTDFYPIQSVRLSAFDGETWKLFGDVLSNESA